jgi:hypothetical protein
MKQITTAISEIKKLSPEINATALKAMLKSMSYTKEQIDGAGIESKKADELDARAVVQALIEAKQAGLKTSDLKKRVAERSGCTVATAGHINSLYKFMKAYHELMTEK